MAGTGPKIIEKNSCTNLNLYYLIGMKFERIDPMKDHQIKVQREIAKEIKVKDEARKAHLAKPYKRSEDAKPFSWDA